LLVDDEPDALDMLKTVLRNCGADVSTASDAHGAFDQFQSVLPDVLVSDIGMPGEDGYALISRVRGLPADKGGKTPAIALTAYARDEDQRRALSEGFQLHLAKPVEPSVVASEILSLAKGGNGTTFKATRN